MWQDKNLIWTKHDSYILYWQLTYCIKKIQKIHDWHSIHTFLASLLCKIQLILPRKVSQSPLHKHFLCQFPRSSTSDKHSLLPSWTARKQNEFNKMKNCMKKEMPTVKYKWNAEKCSVMAGTISHQRLCIL